MLRDVLIDWCARSGLGRLRQRIVEEWHVS